jgi:hypothetical protein
MELFSEQINKINKFVVKLTTRDRRLKLIKLEMEKGMTTEITEIQKIVREYFEKLHSKK